MRNNHLSSEQKEKLIKIGSSLQGIRRSKSISLDFVAANTHISKRLLEAIESGDWEELPEPFYIQALIAKFAEEIGANKTKFILVSELESEIEPFKAAKNSRKYWFNFQLRSLHLYLLYIFLVIISVKGITLLVERPVIINQVPAEKPFKDTATTKAEVVKDNAAQSQPVSQFVSQSSNSELVTVGIDLQERCWLKVMVDGKVAFEGILPQGTQRQWSGQEQVTIRAGNAGGVVISFNNEQQKVLGAPGQVEEITYTVN